jgi:AcrR family transcriptional regulator
MSKPQQRSTITREHLLNAALETLQTEGIAGFTLDRVAECAGISKGGLLYHFPSRDALVEGLLKRTFNNFEQLFTKHLDKEPSSKGRQLRAYIRASFDDSLVSLELARITRAATAENPQLVVVIQREIVRWRKRLLEDGVPHTWMRVIRRASDAYWNDHLLGIIEDNPTDRRAFRDELLRLSYQYSETDDIPSLKSEGDLFYG